jgi:hypothetical protein
LLFLTGDFAGLSKKNEKKWQNPLIFFAKFTILHLYKEVKITALFFLCGFYVFTWREKPPLVTFFYYNYGTAS